jgi:hypothetical protein
VVGVLNRFEVWAPEVWKGFLAESERLLDDVAFELEWPPAPGPGAAPSPHPVTPVTPERPQAKPKRA